MDICSIIYCKDNKKFEFQCSAYSVDTIRNELKQQGAEIREVITYERPKKQTKQISKDELEKRKYYNTKYAYYYRRYKKGNISESSFRKFRDFLMVNKKISENKEQFEEKIKKYEKSRNLIEEK